MASPFDYAVGYYQRELGLTPAQASGAVRWMRDIESNGLRPDAFNRAGGGQGALGIAQWRGSRQRALLDQYGPKPTLDQQLAFSVSELRGDEAAALRALKATSTEDEAFRTWGSAYERPNTKEYAKAIGLRGPRTVRDPATGRDVLYVGIGAEQPAGDAPGEFPEAALDALLGGGAAPGAEPETADDNPLLMLDALLGASGSAPAATGTPAGQQGDMSTYVQPAPAESTPAIAAPLQPTETGQAKPLAAPPAPDGGQMEVEEPGALLDQLLGQAGSPPGLGKNVQTTAGQAGSTAPAVPTTAGQSPESMLDGLLRFASTAVQAAKPALEQLPKAAGDVGTAVAGLAERAQLGALATMPGQPRRAATVPVQQGIAPAIGALEFATGGLLNPLAAPVRGIQQAAGAVARDVEAGVPGVLADVRGGPVVPFGPPLRGEVSPLQPHEMTPRQLVERARVSEDTNVFGERKGVAGATDATFENLPPPPRQTSAGGAATPVEPPVLADVRGGPVIPLGPAREAKAAAAETAKREVVAGKIDEMRELLLPPKTFPVPGVVKDALRRNGLLGFDSIGEVIAAIRSHPDWKARWDMSDETPARMGFNDIERKRFLDDRATIERYVSRPPGSWTEKDFPGRRSIWDDESGALRLPQGTAERLSAAAANFKSVVSRATRGAQIRAVPMAAGDDAGRAIAKDAANLERLARYWRTKWDRELRRFSDEDQVKMWDAMDEASVAAQRGTYDDGLKVMQRLPKEQRAVLAEMETKGIEFWELARESGMVAEKAERLPFYVPRRIVEITQEGARTPRGDAPGMSALDQFGVNLTAGKPRAREYLTAAETEAAAQTKFGPQAEIVRNIRSLPMAYEKLLKDIGGRRLINDLKEIGLASGRPVVVEGDASLATHFTIPGHPMFMFSRGPGMERGQLWISREFEGPLRAIARGQEPMLYRGAMQLKAASMSMIMMSPLIHNQVEWGRALGAMPGKVASFKIYGIGKRVMSDPEQMERAILNGLVPIGQRGYLQDIEGLAMADDLAPGRGLFARGVGGAVGIVSPKAGEAIKRGVDAAGDFWHQKLLWDWVAKLQMGLYSEFEKHLIKKGAEPDGASKIAAHLANRYAGALPAESMSNGMRMILNTTLFSRSFTMGNLGVMKDMFTGLPRDVRAQLGRDLTEVERKFVTGIARKKAITTFIFDIGIAITANALIQDGLEALRNDPKGAMGWGSAGAGAGIIAGRLVGGIGGALVGGAIGGLAGLTQSDIGRIADDYVERFHGLVTRAKEDLSGLWNPLEDLISLTPQHENEPGKGERVKIPWHRKDGTAVYARVPVGKIGEEFTGWTFRANEMAHNKLGTFARPLLNIWNNDRGFGRKVYNKHPEGLGDIAKNFGSVAWEMVRTQTPDQQLDAIADILGFPTWLGGSEAPADWADWARAGAPLAGFTVSKGAPGGEHKGELFRARDIHEDKLNAARPRVRDLVRAGKSNEAAELLESLGVDPRSRNAMIRSYEDPSRAAPSQMRKFDRYSTPEQKRRMQMQQREQGLRHSTGQE